MRLGFVSEFLARPVLVGFISGVGIFIIVGQLPKLLGLSVQSGNVPETLWRTIGELDELGWETPVARRAASLAALLVLRHFAPRVPWALVVAAVSVALSRAFDLAGPRRRRDRRRARRAFRRLAIPALGLGEIGALSGGAVALALISIAESIGAARSLAAQRGYRDRPEPGARRARRLERRRPALLQGFPVDASLSRSAVAVGRGRAHAPLGPRSSRCCSSRRCSS